MEDPLNDTAMILEHVQLIHYIQFLGLTYEWGINNFILVFLQII